jgi:general secretion pathway protein M
VITYWNNLNERERLLLIIASACCLFFLFYLLIYSPLVDGVQNKTGQLIEKQDTLAFLRKARMQQKTIKKVQVLSQGNLLTVLTEQLTTSSFHQSRYQLQQTASGDIQLSFDAVPFNPFMHWLWSMNENYSFLVKQFHAEHTVTPGVVKLVLTIH